MRNYKWLLYIAIGILLPLGASAQQTDEILTMKQKQLKAPGKSALLGQTLRQLEEIYKANIFYKSREVGDIVVNKITKRFPHIELHLSLLLEPLDMTYRKLTETSFVVYQKEQPEGQQARQQETVSGMVTDAESGETLPGVNVMVKETTTGTSTDGEGRFELTVESLQDTLIVSFVGYQTQEVAINGQTEINIQLTSEAIMGEEMVVVGYGEQQERDLTGSISSVTPEDIQRQPVARVGESLQGRAPGVDVSRVSGAPGSGVRIRVRGANSLRSNNAPLVVIDGYIGGDLSRLNPNDISSINILKGTSATAIYGSRGANGVIIVETKQGQSGEPRVTFESRFSSQHVSNNIDMLDPVKYAELINERKTALGQEPQFNQEEIETFQSQGGTDWQDEIFRTGFTQNYSLSVGGGDPALRYYVSGNLVEEQGTLINTNFKKYGFQANINSEVSSHVDLNLKVSGSRENHHNTDNLGQFIQGPVMSALVWPPTMAVRDENGNYTYLPPYGPRRPFQNPAFLAQEQYADNIISSFLTVGSAEFQLLDNLSLTVNGSMQIESINNNNYNRRRPEISISAANAGVSSRHGFDWQHSEVLTYDKDFNANHRFKATAIFEQQRHSVRNHNASATGLPTLALGYNELGIGETQNAGSGYTEWSLMSYVGRANYTLMDRYLFTGTVRMDGSSRFAENNRYSNFPSAAFAWRISEESFLREAEWLDDLKLRTSWGRTGNQAIGAYATVPNLGTGQDLSWDGGSTTRGIGPTAPANTHLIWETTEQTNFGLDISMLENRLSATVDVYHKLTSDLLLQKSIPTQNGYGSILVNQGKVQNQGMEFSLSGMPIQTEEFRWDATLNFSANRNTVIELGAPSVDNEYTFTGNFLRGQGLADMFRIEEGKPLGQFYGLIYDGVWQQDEAEEAARYGQKPGDAKYRDLNDNGAYDDLTVIGNGIPDFTWGLTSSFQYKRFSFDVLVHGVQGQQMFNPVRYFMVGGGPGVRMGASSLIADHWTTENTDTEIPAFSSTSTLQAQSSFSVEDASYVRLRNVTLGYDLPASLLNNSLIRSARVYVSGRDLLTLTSYSGYDPEVNSSGGSDVSQGIDMGAYPNARTFTLGVKVDF